jgi:polyhydroxyalkanoate synthesis regulator phasin
VNRKSAGHYPKEVRAMSVIKNIMLLGWGVASLTREKVEEAVEDLIKRGEIASADKAKAIDELQQKAQTAAGEIRKLIDERIEAVGKKLRRDDELRRLEAELAELKAKITALEQSKKTKGTKKQ